MLISPGEDQAQPLLGTLLQKRTGKGKSPGSAAIDTSVPSCSVEDLPGGGNESTQDLGLDFL